MSERPIGVAYGMYFTQSQMDWVKSLMDYHETEAERLGKLSVRANYRNRKFWEEKAIDARGEYRVWKNLHTVYLTRVGVWSKTHPDPNGEK